MSPRAGRRARRIGKEAGPNPWGAAGLEWQTSSPPTVHNFDEPPVAPERPYDYPLREYDRELS